MFVWALDVAVVSFGGVVVVVAVVAKFTSGAIGWDQAKTAGAICQMAGTVFSVDSGKIYQDS